jgi:S-adenosylmethionine/arginine decarboxylase-like enzyme
MQQMRSTLVVELTTPNAVGRGPAGERTIRRYLSELADVLGLAPVQAPRTHLSPKFGLSGWLPLSECSAIHLYAWDDRTPGFVSVDVSSPGPVPAGPVVAHARRSFGVGPDQHVACKNTGSAAPGTPWRDLAPDICRQRLSLRARTDAPVARADVAGFLPALSRHLDMQVLSAPLCLGSTAWMHWETSGVLAHWEGRTLDMDIYTCKPFHVPDALDFTTRALDAAIQTHASF